MMMMNSITITQDEIEREMIMMNSKQNKKKH